MGDNHEGGISVGGLSIPFRFPSSHHPAISLLTNDFNAAGGGAYPSLAKHATPLEDALGYSSVYSGIHRTQVTSQLLRRALLRGKSGSPKCFSFRPETDRILCGLASGEVASYSAATLDCEDLKRILAATGEITALCPLRSADCLLLGDGSGKIHFATHNFAPLNVITAYSQQEAVYAVCTNPTETVCVVGVRSTNPILMDIAHQTTIGTMRGLGFGTSCLQWHPRRSLIGAGGRSHQVQLWDPREAYSGGGSDMSAPVSAFAHRGPVKALQWHPSNDFVLLTAGRDQLIYLWDIRNRGSEGQWAPMSVIKLSGTETPAEQLVPIGFNAGESLATSTDSAAMCPWCQMSKNSPGFLRTDFDPSRLCPNVLAWHPTDPELFALGDSAGMITFYKDQKCVGRVDNALSRTQPQTMAWSSPPPIEALLWHPNGTMLTAAAGPAAALNGTVTFWKMPSRWGSACDPPWCGHSCHLRC